MNRTIGIYALYDTMTKEFMPVFQMHNNETAIRNIVNAHIKGNIEFPDDVHLIKLGELQIIEGNDANLVNALLDLGSISSLAEFYNKKPVIKDPEVIIKKGDCAK